MTKDAYMHTLHPIKKNIFFGHWFSRPSSIYVVDTHEFSKSRENDYRTLAIESFHIETRNFQPTLLTFKVFAC